MRKTWLLVEFFEGKELFRFLESLYMLLDQARDLELGPYQINPPGVGDLPLKIENFW